MLELCVVFDLFARFVCYLFLVFGLHGLLP